MIPLVASSILVLAVVLERWLFWQRFRTQEDGERILALVSAGLLPQALEMHRADLENRFHDLPETLNHMVLLPDMPDFCSPQ